MDHQSFKDCILQYGLGILRLLWVLETRENALGSGYCLYMNLMW